MTQSQIVPELKKQWETAIQAFNTKLTFDMDKLSLLLDCTVRFEKSQIRHDELVRLNLFVRFVHASAFLSINLEPSL